MSAETPHHKECTCLDGGCINPPKAETPPSPDVGRLIERLRSWRERLREQLPIGVGSLLKEAADALAALQAQKDGWREKWINDKGIRDEEIARLELQLRIEIDNAQRAEREVEALRQAQAQRDARIK